MSETSVTVGTKITAYGGVNFDVAQAEPHVRDVGGPHLAINVGPLSLLITPADWRALNTAVEQHIAQREQMAAAS